MSLLEQKKHVADLMLQIERELRAHGLWEDAEISTEQAKSTEPFACDVMPLQQWLQWVFLPRMKVVIESDADLPHACNISAYAEESVAKLAINTDAVVAVIKQLDEALSVPLSQNQGE